MKQVLLAINNVYKYYNSQSQRVCALKGISLEIYQGEIFGLLGTNGAGKTTLSSLIATVHPLSEGEILYKGTSIYNDVSEYRMHIGFCPQKPNFEATLSVKENLLFAGKYFEVPKDVLTIRVEQLLTQFELDRYAHDKPDILSGGYKQRLLIARALVHRPSLIILDEPTVALDPHIRRQLWDMIKELKQEGITVLLTTHYLDEAEFLADRVCILDRGAIKLIDTPSQLNKLYGKDRLEDVFIELMHSQKELV
jgi:ABC-2 type transport system ATP-binding protein